MFHHLAQPHSQFCPSAEAEGGTAKIKLNPTQVREEMDLPVRYVRHSLRCASKMKQTKIDSKKFPSMCVIPSVAKFCFVFDVKFQLTIGPESTSGNISPPRPEEHVKNATQGMTQSRRLYMYHQFNHSFLLGCHHRENQVLEAASQALASFGD